MRCARDLGVALAAVVAVTFIGIRPSLGQAGPASPGASSIEKALDKPVALAWRNLELTVCLKDLSKIGRVKITLDPGLPDSVGETPVNCSAQDVPLHVALGKALHAAGLRYAITETEIFVSTRGRLARKLVYERQEDLVESRPMTEQEALAEVSRREWEEEEAFTLGDPAFTIDCRPHRFQERPRYNPLTGLTDYPAPPIWLLGDDDRYNARFRYSRVPYFMRPEALEEQGARGVDREAIARIVEIIRRNPDWFQEKVLRELRKETR